MKLSEAIRLGAMLKPKGRGGYIRDTSCALMAAAEAVGMEPDGRHVDYVAIGRRWPFVLNVAPAPRGLDDLNYEFLDNTKIIELIYVLNDCTNWTREQI